MMLTSSDYEMLARSWITPELAEAAGLYRVSSPQGGLLIGRNGHGDYAGIALPYFWPGETRPREYRLRLDHPEMELQPDGTAKEKRKYLAPPGRSNMLYFAPGLKTEALSDISLPIAIAEGEKKVLALSRLSGIRFLPVGLSGVWNWRGTVGREPSTDGTRVPVKGPIPDLDRIQWQGRTTYIIFDSDKKRNTSIQAAERELAHELKSRGAVVRIVDLPDLPGLEKTGIDDYLACPAGGPERTLALIETAAAPGGVTLEDFYAYMPMHAYIFVPGRDLWPAASVNARIKLDNDRKASAWLDANRSVEQMTWAPGEPTIIRDHLFIEGGRVRRVGCACFNLYRPPQPLPGDAAKAGPWLDHVRGIYPSDADHIILWLAHRVQKPYDKINHAIVLGGLQGIGKDTLLEPVKHAIGPWNFSEISPAHLLGRFNPFIKSVILRINEARDLGDVDRYGFYDHLKSYTAAPPDVLRCDEKNIREYNVLNVCGVIITTNHKTDGIYLPADDRRHYVAWSDSTRDDFNRNYWTDIYRWYAEGGYGHVAAYLQHLDLSSFDAKAPPPKTEAFWAIVDANRAPEDAEISDALDALDQPDVVTLEKLILHAGGSFSAWLTDRKNSRQIPHRMESVGYLPVRNPASKDGLWKIGGKRQVVYGRRELSPRQRMESAGGLTGVGR